MSGPLAGLRVVEMAGIGPAPFCGMVLADLGADVVRVDRIDAPGTAEGKSVVTDVLARGRRSVAVDLKAPDGIDLVLRLVGWADALIEGFRPGVMERLGLGPDECLARNGRLVYGRMTGWGQDGPYAAAAGHDINFIALAGALEPIGRAGGPPVPPLNLVGDFGGGGMLLAVGVLGALLHVRATGQGQVVDAAMVDGASLLMSMFHGFRAAGTWTDERGANLIDTGSHFYDVYETADGRYVAVGAVEAKFHAQLLAHLGIDTDGLPEQRDRAGWPAMKERVAAVFRTRTRDEWCARLEGTDVCFAPVLGLGEAPTHPHNRHRQAFVEVEGVVQPAPAPRFSVTPAGPTERPPEPGAHTEEVLAELGLGGGEVARLRASGVVRSR